MKIVAVAAHPDDLEIGAGGLLAEMCRQGHDLSVVILTLEDSCRETEAVRSLEALGISADQVSFLRRRDGHLTVDRETVSELRELFPGAHEVDLVITHTLHDSHQDHRAANQISRGAFRSANFLLYSVYISAEISEFCPTVARELTELDIEIKRRSIDEHRSQRVRLGRLSRTGYEALLGQTFAMDRCEAFEELRQFGAPSIVFDLQRLQVQRPGEQNVRVFARVPVQASALHSS